MSNLANKNTKKCSSNQLREHTCKQSNESFRKSPCSFVKVSYVNRPKVFSMILVLVLILSVSLYGCTDNQMLNKLVKGNDSTEISVTPQTIEPKGAKIKAPIDIQYTIKNPIELVTETVRKDDNFDYSYLQIDELKDKEIQQKINKKLKDAYDKIAIDKIPPYRGIKAQYPNPGRVYQEWISMQDVGNFNNILSVIISKSTHRTLKDGDISKPEVAPSVYDQSWYVSETEILNIDLNTGEEITLADLFCNNVDYMNLINSYVNKKLLGVNASEEGYYTLDNLKQVESFKGFQTDCKFAIYDFGISFIFDYNTPEFETGFSPVNLFVEYNQFHNKIAITKRFYDEKNSIFESKKPLVKQLQIKVYENDLNREDSFLEGNVQIFKSIRNSSQYPKIIQEEIKELSKIDKDLVQHLNNRVTEAKTSGNHDDIYANYELMTYANTASDYISIGKTEYLYSSLDNAMSMPRYLYKTYNIKTLKEVNLKDIFADGFDYMSAIKKGIDKNQGTLYSKITGIGLESVGMYLSTEEQQNGNTVNSLCYIPYEDIGCDNLTIF